MRFSPFDLMDSRIVEHSYVPLDFSEEKGEVPRRAGVYVFTNDADEVLYVGKAGEGRLCAEVQAKEGTPASRGAREVIWAATNSDRAALDLESEWIRKYQPPNNERGKG